MKKNKAITVRDLIDKISSEIEVATPTKKQIIADLKMMSFKVRPLSGDLFSISANSDISLLTSLWRIGKIEEVVRIAVDVLSESEMESFFHYLDDLQERLGSVTDTNDSQPVRQRASQKLVKLEIFRDPDYGLLEN